MENRLVILFAAILFLVSGSSWSQASEGSILKRAMQLYDAKDYAGCMRQLQVLPLDERKAAADIYHLLGLCQYNLGEYEKSISSFGISLAKDQKMTGNYYERGYAYLQLDRYRECARDFEMWLKTNSDKQGLYVNKLILNYSFCLVNTGETEKAIEYLEENHRSDPDLLHALAFYTMEYKKDLDEAIVYWEQVVNIDPKHRSARENLSISYYDVDDYNMAFYHIEKLIEFHPTYGRAHYIHGLYFEETGEEADALIAFERAKELGYVEEE